jgi:hypothetical protein
MFAMRWRRMRDRTRPNVPLEGPGFSDPNLLSNTAYQHLRGILTPPRRSWRPTLTIAEHFTVQPLETDTHKTKPACIHVDAQGPLQAAQIALGEKLCLHGSPGHARAVVWKLGEDYSPVSVTLYAQTTPQT